MPAINLKSLVGRLGDHCRNSIESAVGLCVARTHYNVEIEHWLLKLLETAGNDVDHVCAHFGVDVPRLQRELTGALDRFDEGSSRGAPALAPSLVELARESWMLASLEFGATRVRSGHVLLTLIGSDSMLNQIVTSSREFEKISRQELTQV